MLNYHYNPLPSSYWGKKPINEYHQMWLSNSLKFALIWLDASKVLGSLFELELEGYPS